MDFDFGTLIYIILGIIYFIFTSANKKKKNTLPKTPSPDQPQAETLGPPPGSRPSFEELLEEFTTGKTKEVREEKELAPVFVEEKKPMVSKSKPLPIFEKHKRMKQDFNQFEEFEEKEEVKSEYATMFSDLEGAKKAFVASEIFKRKY